MECEVLVVGAGIGGLTVASLLAKRGVDVCLLEREPRVGGCAAAFENFGYQFEHVYGLFSGWGRGEIHERVNSELGLTTLQTEHLDPNYVVRIGDAEVRVQPDDAQFYSELRRAFPECAEAAVESYAKLTRVGDVLHRAALDWPELFWSSKVRRIYELLRHNGSECVALDGVSADSQLRKTSGRFRSFLDAQLRLFTQGDSSQLSYLSAAYAVSKTRADMFAIRGGAPALAEALALSFKQHGGKLRLNTPVLRLSYNSAGTAVGVDLLSGETVRVNRAIVSNLTVWDTYGKLVGLNRTPSPIRKMLTQLRGRGAYLIYMGVDHGRPVPEHLLSVSESGDAEDEFMFSMAPAWDNRAPEGKRAATVHFLTDVEDWFTFHQDERDAEDQDQRMLEKCWASLHRAVPELGSAAEVIDTATPRTFYESTRRKLGMVGGVIPSRDFWLPGPPFETSLPNVVAISDTTDPFSSGVDGLTGRALLVATKLT
jgi:phytoene dehydrogenase-like protein